ncbi:hypothetical protein Ccel_2163 [Ruminiclostridium cellulolyticum H10]|uniref:Uncharacterized protein n=1 Tax=Ruminiclostridium cellulolyticum (strain ATCC 35319 / DSM 5812 / JCM 6584 / H10) TaxID=394503 RepID=B8I472_RUMCH|nr:hypothetical protein Ccel_2163 [Ruminiclostridium cellulolyticum H10]
MAKAKPKKVVIIYKGKIDIKELILKIFTCNL